MYNLLSKGFFIVLSVIVFVLTIQNYIASDATNRIFLNAQVDFFYLGLPYVFVFLFLAIKPSLILVVSVMYLIIHLITNNVIFPQFPVAIYISITFLLSYILTKIVLRNILEKESEIRLLITFILMLIILFINPFFLLLIHALSSNNLFLLLGSELCLSLIVNEKYFKYKIFENSFKNLLKKKAPVSFEWGLTLLLVLVVFLMFFRASANSGDENKAYLAVARYYVEANKLFLTEVFYREYPAYAFPHFQEIIFSAGYTLGKALGIKLLGFFVTVIKLYSIFLLSFLVFKLPKKVSLGVVCLYLLTPFFINASITVSLENLLTFVFCTGIIFLERSRNTEKINEKILLVTFVFILLSISCMAKYTGAYLVVAFGAVYFREFWNVCITNFKVFFFKTWPVLLCCFVFTLFFYVRNICLFDVLLSVSPYQTNDHLRINKPPLNGFDDIYNFLTRAFLFSLDYTEFSQHAYGIFGFVLMPVAILALGIKKYRKAIFIFFIYLILLCSQTRQIRYLSPVMPILFIVLMDLFYKVVDYFYINRRNANYFIFGMLIICNLRVLSDMGFLSTFRDVVSFEKISDFKGDISVINDALKKNDITIGMPATDTHFEIKSKYYRLNPSDIKSFCNVLNDIEYDYFLFYLEDIKNGKILSLNNDYQMISTIGTIKKQSGNFILLKPNGRRIKRLCKEVKDPLVYNVVSEYKYNVYYKNDDQIYKKFYYRNIPNPLIFIKE